MERDTEVVTLGHAIVDVLAPSDDALVAGFGLEKGTMTLIDERQAETIYASLGPGHRGVRRFGGQHRGLPGLARRIGPVHRESAGRRPRAGLYP